ncbi:MAG: molecular chaperone [Cocleimonas sp.]|nr:molecular chaperone [Cocleimonas sp.]
MIKITSLIIFLMLSFLSPTLSAFGLKPLFATLSPAGAGAEHVFRVTNTGDKPIAVQFSTTTREQKADGTETQTAADDAFMIYPPQAVIAPNKTQKVRVQWLGEQNPTKELAYRFIAEQVPVNLSKGKSSGVQMVMTVVGSIYIAPKGVEPKLSMNNLRRSGNKLVFSVQNSGTKHALLDNLKIDLSSQGQSVQLSGKQVAEIAGKNILAGSQRNFSIAYPAGATIDENWAAQLSVN